MLEFEKLLDSVYVLKVPNGGEWTGVFLLTGAENMLIDCGPSSTAVDEYIIPALLKLGLKADDIAYVTNTHAHGDHSGGDFRFLRESGAKLANGAETAAKLADPLPHSIKTRAKWPEYSPKAPGFIQDNRTDIILKDGDMLGGRLRIIYTPGHDTECVSFFDTETRSLFTGDSLQEYGTIGEHDAAGVAFYKSLPDYRRTLELLKACEAENIFAAHDFKPYGFCAIGRESAERMLAVSCEAVERYDRDIREMLASGMTDIAGITSELLHRLNSVTPEYLFMAMYTVDAHIKEISAAQRG